MTADHHVDILERNFVRGVYDLDLQAFRRGIYSDLVEKAPELFLQKEIAFLESKVTSIVSHIQASLTHIAKGRRKQLVIFLDNADQRDEETQQRVFLMAQEFADHWPMLVFVALRPETFYRSHQFGALSGYHPKAFTISPPRVDRVLETRLNFALKITTGTIPVQHIAGLGTRLETLNDLIHVFLNSLRENKNLAVCIDNVSGGNIRLALDLVRQFFGSGHVDTEKIWGLYKLPDGYIIPLHEFLRAIIYGDTRFFDPSRSPIANLFRISTPDPREHFLGPLTLAAASNLANTEGFADTYAVYDLLQGYGFTGNQVDAAVANCVKKHLLETTARRIPQPGQALPSLVRTTTVGEYHLQFLLPSFVFMDAVVVDTPVLDEAFRAQIHNVEDIADRLSRCEVFRHYLDSCWQSFSTPPSVFSWPERSALIANEVSRISRRVEENRRRPSSTR